LCITIKSVVFFNNNEEYYGKPFFCMTIVATNVCWRSRQFSTSAKVSARHYGHQDTSAPVGWCRNVLGPKCPVLGPKYLDTKKDSSTLVPICPDTSAPV